MKHRQWRLCAKCDRQVSPLAGMIWEHTRLPVPKRFVAVNLMGTDKSGFSAEQSGWHSSLGDRDRVCWLYRLVERVNSESCTNGSRSFILSSTTSKAFRREHSAEYHFATFRNILTSLIFAFMVDSGNLSCRNDCFKLPSIMGRFELPLLV